MTPFETFLVELAKVLEFSLLKPDERGACLILLKESKLSLLFEYDDRYVPNTILISSELFRFPIEHRKTVYAALLQGNHALEETLSVKPDDDLVYLHRRVHPLIESVDLEKVMHSFTENATFWRNKLVELTSQPPQKQTPQKVQPLPYKA